MDELIVQPDAPATPNPQPVGYVTYTEDGALDGCYFQVPPQDHSSRMIAVDEFTRTAWVNYRANEARDGVELAPPAPADLAVLKATKNDQINAWRAAANLSTFPHAGKLVACDALSRSDIDGVANNIGLFGGFPEGFPMAWKATDNTYIRLVDVDAFKAMYGSMTAQGTSNFNHAQTLKAQLASAKTPEEVEVIAW